MGEETLKDSVERLRQVFIRLGRLRSFRDPLSLMADLELSPPQVHLLMWLGTDGQLPMGVLAQRIGTTLPAATRNVDRLHALGLVLRERDAADRRVVLARLSAKGARTYAKFEEHVCQKLSTILGAVEEEDRHHLLAILERLEKNVLAAVQAADVEKAS